MRLRGERGGSEELWSHRVEKWDILVIIKAGKKVVKRSLKGRFSLVGDLEHFLIYFLGHGLCLFYRPYMVDASYGLFHHHRVVIVDLFDGR